MTTTPTKKGSPTKKSGRTKKTIDSSLRFDPSYPLWKLKPFNANPRRNDRAVSAVANSIEKFGFINPIIADENGVICAGHTRYKAATKKKLKKVPVIFVAGLTGSKFAAYNIADNALAQLSTWASDELAEQLKKLANDGYTTELLGFGDVDVDALKASLDEPEFSSFEKAITEVASKKGDGTEFSSITFTFTKTEMGIVNRYIEKNSKEELGAKIIALCREKKGKR